MRSFVVFAMCVSFVLCEAQSDMDQGRIIENAPVPHPASTQARISRAAEGPQEVLGNAANGIANGAANLAAPVTGGNNPLSALTGGHGIDTSILGGNLGPLSLGLGFNNNRN